MSALYLKRFLDFQIFNSTMFWNWSRDGFIPGVFAGEKSNYIGDNCSVRIGQPQVRQLRVKPGKYVHIINKYIPNKWIAFSARSDWLIINSGQYCLL